MTCACVHFSSLICQWKTAENSILTRYYNATEKRIVHKCYNLVSESVCHIGMS